MRTILPLLAFCTACSPAIETSTDGSPLPVRTFKTQRDAPSPDYNDLLQELSVVSGGRKLREATSPAPPNAKAIGDFWIKQLKERGALLGYGLAGEGASGHVELIDTGLTELEFKNLASTNGWRVPSHIRWSFVSAMSLPPVSEAARDLIRVWPASKTRTGAQPQALFYGKIELRDGCFYVGFAGEPVNRLAWFHSEVGLDIDAAGYLVLRDRISRQMLARIGEQLSWGGPASADIDKEVEQALQEACGPREIYIVGSPEARERFLTQYPHLREPAVSPPSSPQRN